MRDESINTCGYGLLLEKNFTDSSIVANCLKGIMNNKEDICLDNNGAKEFLKYFLIAGACLVGGIIGVVIIACVIDRLRAAF